MKCWKSIILLLMAFVFVACDDDESVILRPDFESKTIVMATGEVLDSEPLWSLSGTEVLLLNRVIIDNLQEERGGIRDNRLFFEINVLGFERVTTSKYEITGTPTEFPGDTLTIVSDTTWGTPEDLIGLRINEEFWPIGEQVTILPVETAGIMVQNLHGGRVGLGMIMLGDSLPNLVRRDRIVQELISQDWATLGEYSEVWQPTPDKLQEYGILSAIPTFDAQLEQRFLNMRTSELNHRRFLEFSFTYQELERRAPMRYGQIFFISPSGENGVIFITSYETFEFVCETAEGVAALQSDLEIQLQNTRKGGTDRVQSTIALMQWMEQYNDREYTRRVHQMLENIESEEAASIVSFIENQFGHFLR